MPQQHEQLQQDVQSADEVAEVGGEVGGKEVSSEVGVMAVLIFIYQPSLSYWCYLHSHSQDDCVLTKTVGVVRPRRRGVEEDEICLQDSLSPPPQPSTSSARPPPAERAKKTRPAAEGGRRRKRAAASSPVGDRPAKPKKPKKPRSTGGRDSALIPVPCPNKDIGCTDSEVSQSQSLV